MMKCVLLIFVLVFGELTQSEDRVVDIDDGSVRGRVEQTPQTSRDLYVFEKIPYATPPLGKLRFQAPIPNQKWSGILNATGLDVMCYQVTFDSPKESEDCLYLNVYTTYIPVTTDHLFPVIVYLFGGGFIQGDASQLNPGNLIEQDVVVVSINSRVGPLGFLSTGDDVIPGNAGLKDQQLALQWVHNNIKAFGGDPKLVTLLGISAGSASATYQLLNKKNDGLIKSVILNSGTFLSPWAFQRNAREIAFNTTAILNPVFKSSRDSKALLSFLQQIAAKSLDRASAVYQDENPNYNQLNTGFYYAPVVEAPNPTAFITQKMYGLLKSGNILSVPALVGVTSEEMLFYFQDATAFKYTLSPYDSLPNFLVPPDMQIRDVRNVSSMGANIRALYTSSGKKLSDNLGRSLGYFSDNGFARSIIRYAELISKFNNQTYFYEFSYQGAYNARQVYYEGAGRASHTDDFILLNPLGNLTNDDKLAVQRQVQIVTDFAKYQDPTPEKSDLLNNIKWPAIDTRNGDFQYVEINKTMAIRNHPKNETYGAWVKLYNSLGRDDFDTY